jgi:hypothetical protein
VTALHVVVASTGDQPVPRWAPDHVPDEDLTRFARGGVGIAPLERSRRLHMTEKAQHGDTQSGQPDAEERKVATMAVRLPILIAVAVLLMFAIGVLAMQMYGG